MDEIRWMPARTMRELVATKELSPVDVVTALLAVVEAFDPELRAFVTVAPDHALEQARAAEAAVLRGDPLGPLHGVPVALKDEAWTWDLPSTAGSLLFARFRPQRDGTVAERLRHAGAIVFGKTNMPEFAAWPRSKNRLAGEAVNPWDPSRITGASSGGSAGALAAGMIPLAIGSDGGGSIRIPSALCGTVGLYPTPGRVPSYGSFSYSPAGSLGPMGRDVHDVALLHQVIAGPDPRDGGALTTVVPDATSALDDGVDGRRVAWSPDFGHWAVQPGIADAVASAMAALEDSGAHVEPTGTELPHPWGDARGMAERQAAVAAYGDPDEVAFDAGDLPDLTDEEWWMWEVFAGTTPLTQSPRFAELRDRYAALLTPPSRPAPGTRGMTFDGAPPVEALRAAFDAALGGADVLCSPTMRTVAPVAPAGWGTPYDDPYMGTNFTFIANALGCAAASVPCGLVDGLPVGLQIVGRPGAEATVLRVARAFEIARPFRSLAPPRGVTTKERA
jgi:Asp-tRNA(Asn)/Glu-tRNA(Gln) amidotransferase A subunit family amidase